MAFLKNLFGGGVDPATLKKYCYELELLPAGLTDLTPYRCQLGGGLLNDPVKDKHGHLMCSGCANERINPGLNCQVDQNRKHKLRKEELLAYRQMDLLSLRCPNSRQESNSCAFSFRSKDYSDYLNHKNGCPKQLVTCTSADCQAMIYRQDLNEHLQTRCQYAPIECQYCRTEMRRLNSKAHSDHCPEWPVHCENKECTHELKRKVLRLHVDQFCGLTRIKCPKRRCQAKFLRKDLQEHEPLCEYKDVTCQYCSKIYEKADKEAHESICLQFPLECKHKGCDQILPRRLWEPHFANDCPMMEISCPSEGCSAKFLQKDKDEHLKTCEDHKLCCEHCKVWIKRKFLDNRHYNVCPEFPIECQNRGKCVIIVRRGQRQAHIQSECPYTQLTCRYIGGGCRESLFRRDLPAHEKECDYQPKACPLCNVVMPRINIQRHIDVECPEHRIPCVQKCEASVIRKLMKQHIETACGETEVECEYRQFGCNMRFRRKETEEHIRTEMGKHHSLILRLTYGLKQQNIELANRQQVFHLQLEQLAAVVQGLVTQTGRLESQNRNNFEEIKAVNRQCTEIIRSEDQLRNRTMDLNGKVDQLSQAVGTVSREIGHVEKKVKEVSSEVSSCKSNVRDVENAVKDVGRKVDRIPVAK